MNTRLITSVDVKRRLTGDRFPNKKIFRIYLALGLKLEVSSPTILMHGCGLTSLEGAQ